MKPEKKDAATLIVGKLMGKKDGESDGEMSESPAPMSEDESAYSDDSVATDTAAEELLAAIESKSPKGIVEAIKSLIELCQQG